MSAPDKRQHEVVEDLMKILELGVKHFEPGAVDYAFEVYENEDGTKFIGIDVDGHPDDVDELSEWSIQPERA